MTWMPFSAEAASRAVNFFERVLVHVDGEWAGLPFLLMDWQRDMLSRLFGTLRDDGLRQYRTCYVELARKNGKSETAAGIALYLLFADGEEGAQIYGAASDRDQASIVYRVASEMVRRSPVLDKRAKRVDSTKRLVVQSTASFYRAIPADAGGAHGFNASGVIVDEVHVQPNRDLIDVLNTSTGARRQPLTFYITTAGYDRHSICWELHDYALKVRSGVIKDDTFLPVVYSVDEAEDWRRPETWAKANPSLGVTVKLDYLTRECLRAQETPDYENTFRRLHLSQWTRQDTRWMPLAAWDACGGPIDEASLRGRPCFGGLDLANTTDLAAYCLVFPDSEGGYDVLWRCWLPEATIELRSRRDRVPYDLWARQGFVTATDGNVIDHRTIKAEVLALAEWYGLQDMGYDPWNATYIERELQDEGLTLTPIRQGFPSLSAPTKELQKLVLGRRLRHGDNPVARWAADNMVVMTDPAGNIKPAKNKSTEKIDPLVALVMALDRAMRNENQPSCYESQEIRVWG